VEWGGPSPLSGEGCWAKTSRRREKGPIAHTFQRASGRIPPPARRRRRRRTGCSPARWRKEALRMPTSDRTRSRPPAATDRGDLEEGGRARLPLGYIPPSAAAGGALGNVRGGRDSLFFRAAAAGEGGWGHKYRVGGRGSSRFPIKALGRPSPLSLSLTLYVTDGSRKKDEDGGEGASFSENGSGLSENEEASPPPLRSSSPRVKPPPSAITNGTKSAQKKCALVRAPLYLSSLGSREP